LSFVISISRERVRASHTTYARNLRYALTLDLSCLVFAVLLFDPDLLFIFAPPSLSTSRFNFASTLFCLTSASLTFFFEFASTGVEVVIPLIVTGA
jgi:hypothetical protein